ncbi:MAG: ATP-binding cassette domain-containing protein, partial [Frankiaceae bacterium]|nr:ATP-binding cassette domain-containing protein [Frankiaceae bacterium]
MSASTAVDSSDPAEAPDPAGGPGAPADPGAPARPGTANRTAAERPDPAEPPPGWLRRLWGYCMRHRWTVAAAFGAAIGGALMSALVPLVVRHVVDQLVASAGANRAAHVAGWIWLLIAMAAVNYLCTFTRRYSAGRLSLDVQYDMRADVFDSLTRMDGPTQDRIDTGQIVSRSITDIGLVQGLLQIFPALAGNGIMFVLSLVVMAMLSPALTVVTVLVAPALFFVAGRSRRDLFPANWSAQQQSGVLVGHVEAAVTGVRVVKGFGQENRELDALDGEAHILYRLRMRVVRLQAKYSAALQAIPSLGQVGVLILGGWLALHGHISLGTFLAFSTYLAQLVSPVRMLTSLLTVGQQARAGTERVMEVIDTRPTIVDPPHARDIPLGPGGAVEVEFDQVRFGHDPDRPVLDGLSLRVRPGETVAIVGGSGSGKSTLVMLLERIYDPDAGRVLVGGVDVRAARMASVRSMFGVVFEDTFLFSDTIRANIAYGRPDATEEQIVAAARLAQADGFIAALPDGYDAVVGERGMTLSGGQRQRVALARALLADPPVLVLDDATSAIDPRVEARIVAGLRETRRGRGTVIVAHRSSTLELADRIVVLEHGRVAAEGTRAQLTATSPLFRRLMSAAPAANEHAAMLAESGLNHHDEREVTAHLWEGSRQIADRGAGALRRQIIETGGGGRGMGGGGGGGGGGRGRGGPGGGMLSSVPATEALLKRVEALPPALGEPDITPELARAGDSRFGLGRLLRPVRGVLSIGLGLVALDTVAQLIVPALVRGGIDNGVLAGSMSTLTNIGMLAFAVILTDWVISRA